MKGKWKVTANPIGGQMMYSAVRLIDASKIEHSGNRECHGEWVADRKDAEKLVEELNGESE